MTSDRTVSRPTNRSSDHPIILAAIETQVDINLVELAELLRGEHHPAFAPSTIWRFLDRHAITIKKTAHASE